MKKMLGLLAVMMMVISVPVMSQQGATGDEDAAKDAGVTPDSLLWGIDVALDKLALALSLGDKAKAEKGMEIAEERLLEIKIMAGKNKSEGMAKAEAEHGKIVAKIRDSVELMSLEDPSEEAKAVILLEKKLEDNEDVLEGIKQQITLKGMGNLTEQQQSLIDSVISNLEGQTGELKIKIENKMGKSKIKIKAKTGKSEIEIERELEEEEIEIRGGIAAGLKEEFKVVAETEGSSSLVKLELRFVTKTSAKDALVEEIISKFRLDEQKAGELLKVQAGNIDDQDADRLRIRVDNKDGVNEARVELRFLLNSTDRSLMAQEIAKRSNLAKAQVEPFVIAAELGKEKGSGLVVKAETEGGVSFVKAELKFISSAANKEDLVKEILDRFSLTKEEADALLKLESGDIDAGDSDRLRIRAREKGEGTEVEVELRFLLNTEDRNVIVEEIAKRTQIEKAKAEAAVESEEFREDDEDDREDELEIEIEIRGNHTEVRVKERGNVLDRFVTTSTDKEELLGIIAKRRGVSVDEIRAVAEFEPEDGDEAEDEDDGNDEDRDFDRQRGRGSSSGSGPSGSSGSNSG